jgi:hypothetical protein
VSQYAGMPCERLVQIAAPGSEPSRSSAPHIVLSPRTSRGLPTSGMAFTLLPPSTGAAVAGAGFSIAIFRAIPVLGSWAALQLYEAAGYGEQLTLPDLSGGMALYFHVFNLETAGNVILAIAELD